MTSPSKIEAIGRAENFFNELDFRKLLFRISYHKWFILILTCLSSALTLIYALNLPPRYTSTALIQVDNQLGSANSMQQMLGNIGTTFAASLQVSPADIEIALIKSRFILQSVIESLKLNLSVKPYYFPFIGKRIAELHDSHTLRNPFLHLNQFAWGGELIQLQKIVIHNNNNDELFYLRADDENHYSLLSHDGRLLLQGQVGKLAKSPNHSAITAEMLVSKLKANQGTYFKINLKHDDDVLKTLALGLAINDLGEKSKTKTGVLQLSFQGRDPEFIAQVLNKIIDFAIQRNIEKKSAEASKTLDFLNRQLPHVHKSLEAAETNLNLYRAKNGTIDISQEAKNMLMQLSTIEQSIAEFKLKKVEMLQELTPQHPYVISLTQKQFQLQREVHNLEAKIKSLPLTDQRALSLERDVKVKNQLYLLLLNKIQQLQVLKAGTLSDIRILSRATVPITPLPNHKIFIIFSGIFFGFFLSLIIIFLRDIFKRNISSVELVEEKLGIPTFAIIPYSLNQKRFIREMKNSLKRDRSYVLAQCAPNDIAIEGIRSLRTLLQHALNQAHNNIISIIGASPNIGKSFVSINLAQVLVDSGKRVILIDCDMRKGKMHTYFSQKKSPGFSQLLSNKVGIKEVVRSVGTHFDFISAGEYPTNPSELLLSAHLQALLGQFSQDYDMVIVDTPPVLAVTDAILLAKFAAINLMVIGYGKDQIEELELMVKRIKKNDINIHGLVFNSTVEIKGEYSQYNYYYAYESNNN